MSKELVIASNRHETKVAILEDDQLVEIYFQRANEYSLAGSIHKGRVTRVLPGMQSAFVNLGLERDTFLYVSDFFEENEEYDRIASDDRGGRSGAAQAKAVVDQVTVGLVPAVAEPPVAAAVAPAVTAPPADRERREERRDDRNREDDKGDRRGRRSRRRRSRGRGFPDSKYASDVTSAPEETPEAQPEAVEESEPAAEVILLPGESLAKYSRPTSYAETRGTHENHSSSVAEDIPEDEAAPNEPVDFVEETEAIEEPPAPSAQAVQDASPAIGEPELLIPESDAEVETDNETTEAEEDRPENGEDDVEVSISAAERLVDELAWSEPDDEESDDNITESGEGESEVSEAGDPGELESESTPVSVEQAEANPESGEPAARSASVRDQGGRYGHRVSRRMRRRMRGGAGENQESGGGHQQKEQVPEPPPQRPAARPDKQPLPSISELLKEGQEIIVQIAKEPLGQKGARITSHIALPGRYVVYMPTLEHFGVSRKISSDEERQRLKRILQKNAAGITGGCIVRTAGEGRTEDEISSDIRFLYNLWLDIRQKAEKRPAPILLHHDLDIVQRTLRDQLTENFKTVWVDNEELYESVLRFMQRFQPSLVSRVKLYTRDTPIFDAFTISAELEKALRPKVWLKSGGYIVINQTEALVAIDINTGKFVGKSNRLEDTIVKTNLEAVKEIVRQIRLRDLGGIIVVDFIDMDERKNRQKVMQALEEAMRSDRAPYKVLQFNDFGLVAITRKRVKQSLERTLCAPCPACEGAGYVKSVQTVVSEILQEAVKLRKVVEGQDVILRCHPEVAKFLKQNTNKYLEEIEEVLRRTVLVTGDPTLHQEKFDLA